MDRIDIDRLWGNFVDTVTNHYLDFQGRMGRPRYWYFILAYAVIGAAVSVVGSVLPGGSGLAGLYGLGLFLPVLGATSRRLHDTGRSASLLWLLAIPWALSLVSSLFAILALLTFGLFALLLAPFLFLIHLAALAAGIVVIYFCAQPGLEGENVYGAPPGAWTPESPAKPTAT